jgi:hypothetical protein
MSLRSPCDVPRSRPVVSMLCSPVSAPAAESPHHDAKTPVARPVSTRRQPCPRTVRTTLCERGRRTDERLCS